MYMYIVHNTLHCTDLYIVHNTLHCTDLHVHVHVLYVLYVLYIHVVSFPDPALPKRGRRVWFRMIGYGIICDRVRRNKA